MNRMTIKTLLRIACLLSFFSAITVTQAGKINTISNATGSEGFGGWNLENIEVETYKDDLTPTLTEFDETTGAYDPDYFTFDSNIFTTSTTDPAAVLTGVLHGKDFPVGEPAGIKVIHDDLDVQDPKPQNCIMTTSYIEGGYLDESPLEPTICSSPFQTHKRFKVNMLATSLDTDNDISTYEGAVDLVFNVEPGTDTDYQIFQKINNYTGSRLQGFAIQVGTGTSSAFKPANDSGILSKLSIWASLKTGDTPETGIWDPDQLATFSHGLFGAADKNFPEDGFFDNRTAGFFVTPNVEAAGLSDTLTSGDAMENNYAALPIPGAIAPINSQFGPWLHDQITPKGIFFDDDNDPNTDATLMAFWGDVDGTGTTFAWMYGNEDNFAKVEPETLSQWATDTSGLYSVDVIEDMLNLGLNYVVTVGEVDDTWPTWDGDSATFTLRIIPLPDASSTSDPAYVANPPSGIVADIGTVNISPSPEFTIGDSLQLTVADSDAVAVNVIVENLDTGDKEDAVMMTEINPGFFSGQLPTSNNVGDIGTNGTLYVSSGDQVRVSYLDVSTSNTITSTTTAADNTGFFIIPIPNGGAAIFNL